MKWFATRQSRSCDKIPIAELLQDRLDEAATAKVVAHLDHCEHCQRRITEMSANADWWRDAAVCLENAALDESDAQVTLMDELEGPHGPTIEQVLLQSGLMIQSAKPDMLGSIGRYHIRRVIGTGGTGIVLQAVDCELDRIVALKVLAPTLASNGAARRRFSREGQAAASVSHDNVVAIYHVESAGPAPYLVMQYVDGCSLQEWVMRSGPMDTNSALKMIAQLAAALEAAHEQGLVHRDVKPANILVGAAGQRFWITDFGLARAVDDASLTRTGFIAGTPHYMSPEQARGESIGSRSDLFGLGSVLYFALTGRPPFRAERSLAILNRICNEKHRSVREVNHEVSLGAASMVDRLLQKDPRARFQSAEEVRQECLRLLTQTDPLASRVSNTNTRSKRLGRFKLVVTSAVAVLAIATVALFAQGRVWQSRKQHAADNVNVDSKQLRPGMRLNSPANTFQPTRLASNPSVQLLDSMVAGNQPIPSQVRLGASPAVGNATSASTIPDASMLADAPTSQNTPLSTNPWLPVLQNPDDSWSDDFVQLEQELQNSHDSWQTNSSAQIPAIDWQSELFEQQLAELESLLLEVEHP